MRAGSMTKGTLAEIARAHAESGLLLDPHTAVGLRVGRNRRRDPDVPLIVMATAHPSKFAAAVEEATGIAPETARARLAISSTCPNDTRSYPNSLDAVRAHLPLQS